MLRSGRRSELFDRLQVVVSEIPVFRLSNNHTWLSEESEWMIPTGSEIDIERLQAAYDTQTDADKKLIAYEWERFLDVLTSLHDGSKDAHLIANHLARLLDVLAADESELSLSEQILQSLPPIAVAPAASVAPVASAAPVDADQYNDGSLHEGQISVRTHQLRQWQLASGALLMTCIGLLTHSFVTGHFDYVAATERIPLQEIPVLETQIFELSSEKIAAEATTPTNRPTTRRDIGGARVPPDAEAGMATGAKMKPKHVTLRQRVTAAGSIDTIVIEPPAHTGQTPISVTIKPHAPRRIDTTTETARRIIIPDTADLLQLEVTVPSDVIDPTGKRVKKTTFQWQWKEEHFAQEEKW